VNESKTSRGLAALRFLLSHTWVGILVVASLGIGWLLRGGLAPVTSPDSTAGPSSPASDDAPTEWTCSMHPGVRSAEPAKCPICFMDLVPVETSGDDDDRPRRLVLDPAARARIRLDTMPVARQKVEVELALVGKILPDETRLADITAWFGGRIDRLFVDSTGVEVAPGDPLASLYSPELYAAQEELLQALRAVRALEAGGEDAFGDTTRATLDAARERMRQWGLDEALVAKIEAAGVADDHVTIRAPHGGVVIERLVRTGAFVNRGTPLLRIADLSRLWIELEAFESDLAWLALDQPVDFTAEAFPGERFAGRVTFVAPELDERTRTVMVRVEVDNADRRLKPGMFVRATVRANATAGSGAEPPLVVPASAPLLTGRRAIVYVELSDEDDLAYEGREVRLGPRAGAWYVVEEGLEEGELVVTEGAFKLDSELQIRGGRSMMSPGDDEAETLADPEEVEPLEPGSVPDAFRASIGAVWREYVALFAALAGDDYAAARAAVDRIAAVRAAIDAGSLDADASAEWERRARALDDALVALRASAGIAPLRVEFEQLYLAVRATVLTFGIDRGEVWEMYCPMAFDFRGARWLQGDDELLNPYFGDEMLRCGEVLGRLLPPADADDGVEEER